MNIDIFLPFILSTALAKHNMTYFVIKDLILGHLAWALRISNFLRLIINKNEI